MGSRRTTTGLSLIDSVFACLMFGIMVIAMTSVWLADYRSNSMAQNTMIATYLGRQIIEENIAKAPHEIQPVARGSMPPFKMRSSIDGKERMSEFEYAVGIEDWKPNIRNLVVKVWWRDDNLQKELHLETLLYAP